MGFYKALNSWVLCGFGGERSAYDAIDDVAKFGLDGVELTFGDCVPADISVEECEKIAAYAKEKSVALRSMASGFYWGCSLGSEDAAERQRAIEFTEKYLTTASRLGVDRILVVPGAVDVAWDPSRPVVPFMKVWENATASLHKLLPLAEKLNVTICLENVWNKFLTSPLEMKKFIDQFDSEYIGSYFDAANCLINSYAQDWVEILGKRIKAVHIKNFRREDAGGVLHGFGDDILDGDLDFQALLSALKNVSYQGPLTVEMIPFCRLPDLVLPDLELAEDCARKLKNIG